MLPSGPADMRPQGLGSSIRRDSGGCSWYDPSQLQGGRRRALCSRHGAGPDRRQQALLHGKFYDLSRPQRYRRRRRWR